MQQTLDLFDTPAAEPSPAAPMPAPAVFSEPLDVDREVLAKRLYNECQTSKPSWDQLGATTQGVWLERADRVLAGDPQPWSIFRAR